MDVMKLFIFDWGRTLYDVDAGFLFPETKTVLEELKTRGYVLAVVSLASAGPSAIVERKRVIEDEQLSQYFTSIKFDVEDKDRMYADTLRELEIPAVETVIVDDRMVRGIQWGNANSCTTVWLQKGKFADELPDNQTGTPTHTITSIGELLSAV
jgi:FMN phosphatase YigB (HAD superfamily)